MNIDDINLKVSDTILREVALVDKSNQGERIVTFDARIGVVKAYTKVLIERACGQCREGQRSAADSVTSLFSQLDRDLPTASVDLGAYEVHVRCRAPIVCGFEFDKEVVTIHRLSVQ